RRRYSDRRARLQTRLEYAEEWQDPRGSDLARHTGANPRVGRACSRLFTGRVCLSVREALDSPLPGQSLATLHRAEAGEARARLGNVSGVEEDKRQSLKEGGSRSESGIRSEGPRAWCQPGGLHQFRPGAEASSRFETRSSGASSESTSRASFGKPRLT